MTKKEKARRRRMQKALGPNAATPTPAPATPAPATPAPATHGSRCWRLGDVFDLLLLVGYIYVAGDEIGTLAQHILKEHNKAGGDEGSVAILGRILFIVNITTCIHQFFVFTSLHDIDHYPKRHRPSLPRWYYSWIEYTIRGFVLAALIFAIAKIPLKVLHEIDYTSVRCALFVFCFACQFTWDVIAILHAARGHKGDGFLWSSLILWVSSDLFATLSWGMVYWHIVSAKGNSAVVLLTSAGTVYAISIIVRFIWALWTIEWGSVIRNRFMTDEK